MMPELHQSGGSGGGGLSLKERLPPSWRLAQRAWRSWLRGEPELHLVPALCDRSRWSLDIGANNGVYAWHMARASAGVMAFEPQPAHARFLRRAFGARVKVEQVALSDTDGQVRLRVPRERMQDGRATIESSNPLAGFDCDEFTVARRRLDDYVLPRVGMIKIDVEGHELAVIEGAPMLLERDRPNLLIEAEDRHRPNAVADLCDRLGRLGYRPFVLLSGALEAYLPDPRRGAVARDGQAPNNFVLLHDSRAEAVMLRCRSVRRWFGPTVSAVRPPVRITHTDRAGRQLP